MSDLEAILAELFAHKPGEMGGWPSAEYCRKALSVLSRDDNPRLWAALQGTLGNILAQGTSDQLEQDLEEAIASHEKALTVFTRETEPLQWTKTQINLGNCYQYRIKGQRAGQH